MKEQADFLSKPLLLGLLLPLTLFSKQFIITYEAYTKNSLLISEKFYVSDAMTHINPPSIKSSCMIENTIDSNNISKILKSQKDRLLECLFKNGVKLKSFEELKGIYLDTRAILYIDPTRIDAEFNDDFVNIEIFNKK
ncbi:MAG: hypothetical protein ACLFQJ_09720 [Campylobacterales bacterium]